MQYEDRLMQHVLAGMEPSTASLMEFSRTMQAWLEMRVADPGSHVDAGFGEGCRDSPTSVAEYTMTKYALLKLAT